MAKYPFMTRRNGSKNLYYKRPVPKELQAEGRPRQIWRSLGTSDVKAAAVAYRSADAEADRTFNQWRLDDGQPVVSLAPPDKYAVAEIPLTPALLRGLADEHYVNIYDEDFAWKGDLHRRAHKDEEAFWHGDIVDHPVDDGRTFKGEQYSFYAYLMEEPILEDVLRYCVFMARKKRLASVKRDYQLGVTRAVESAGRTLTEAKRIRLSQGDGQRLFRKLMIAEIRALEDLTSGDEATFDGIVDRLGSLEGPGQAPDPAPISPGEFMSNLVEKYLEDTGRAREWPSKTVLRKRSELGEFVAIAGDKPINAYLQMDGVAFKDTQLMLPINRQRRPFRGLSLEDAARKAADLRTSGQEVEFLNPITVNDKIGTVSLFFQWAKARDSSVVNPVADLGIRGPRNKRKGKKRHPWTIDELNKMFAAPIYTGCVSERFWKRPGSLVLRHSAMFWVPLIGLFSGMRLGEIIQMRVADVKCLEGISYFDVTPVGQDADDEEADEAGEEKSLKTASSRRGIPIHRVLEEIGFMEFVSQRRMSGQMRLFPDYGRAKDDESWSKQFSKHFTRFRESVGVTRRGVKFHSLRHNMEDALRNASVSKDVRDAIQGHSESGVAAEYGSGFYLRTLNDAMQKIKYEGLITPSKR